MTLTEHEQRVLAYDATPLLARLNARGLLHAAKRYQTLSINDIVAPAAPGACACGCGQPVKPPQRKWHKEACSYFPYTVLQILRGDLSTVRHYVRLRDGRHCRGCGRQRDEHGAALGLECDHVVPVAEGGAGRWLDNYQLLCVDCHKAKTAAQLRSKALGRRPLPLFNSAPCAP